MLAWILASLTILAGCIGGGPEQDCQAYDCPTTPSPSENPTTEPGPPDGEPNATLQVRWEECEGAFGEFQAARGSAEELVPAGFEVRGMTSRTATARFFALDCPRFANSSVVLPQVAFLELMVEVKPLNDSWPSTGLDWLVVELMTTSPEVGTALARIGAHNKTGSFNRVTTPSPAGPQLEQWRFEASDIMFEFEYAVRGERIDGSSASQIHWYETGRSLRRIAQESQYDYDTFIVQGGTLRLSGSGRAAALAPAPCCAEWSGSALLQHNDVWTGNETAYV